MADMRKSKYSEEQIIGFLRQADSSRPPAQRALAKSRALVTRLCRLQALAAPSGGVVRYADDEAPSEAAERTVAACRRGPFLVLPSIPSADDWERETIAQQVVFMTTGRDPGAS
jgi:hypothetical protein